ncbi:MAG: hypothetical protein ACOCWG_05290, partial [bacterium]
MNGSINKENNVDIGKTIKMYLKNWYWFVIGLFLALSASWYYLKSIPDSYNVETKIIINDENDASTQARAQLMNNIGYTTRKSLINEMQVLRSTPLVEKTLEGLDFGISYYEKGRFMDHELYKTAPFVVIFNPDHPQPIACEFNVKILDEKRYKIFSENLNVPIYNFNSQKNIRVFDTFNLNHLVNFNQVMQSENFDFKLILNSNYNIEQLKEKTYAFRMHSLKGLVSDFQASLLVSPFDKESSIVGLSMVTEVPQKGVDFLKALTNSYIEYDIREKEHASQKTIEYINSQLENIGGSLQIAERNLQQFRASNKLIDVSMQSNQVFMDLRDLENKKSILEMNHKYYTYITE